MASATFILKEPKSKEDTLVYLVFRYQNQRFKYSTGLKINPKYWNPQTQKFRETKDFKSAIEYNTRLLNLSNDVDAIYRRLINDKITPSSELLRSEMDNLSIEKEIKPKNDFLAFIDTLIDGSSKRPNTLKHYKQARRVLIEYSKERKKTLTFEAINLNLYEDFIRFCHSRNYSTNTIGGYIKNIKVFMNEAIDRGLTKNMEFKNKKFQTVEEESESIYLTIQEINSLVQLKLEANSRLSNVRDIFIIGCYTGLRFSDLSKLNNNNLIENNSRLKVKTEKTGEIVVIPLRKEVKNIIAKHNGIPDYSISNQKMNEYLKELGKIAGFEEKVLISSTKGGEKVSDSFKKYELLTVHTARRSFATNAYLEDVPILSIMKITGHKTEKAFLKYIKISQEDNANKLINHKFFI